MREVEEMEASFGTAACYRRLWLDTEADLGLVAETLAEVLGWQPSHDQIVPNALELAEVAARRVAELERIVGTAHHRTPRRPALASLRMSVN